MDRHRRMAQQRVQPDALDRHRAEPLERVGAEEHQHREEERRARRAPPSRTARPRGGGCGSSTARRSRRSTAPTPRAAASRPGSTTARSACSRAGSWSRNGRRRAPPRSPSAGTPPRARPPRWSAARRARRSARREETTRRRSLRHAPSIAATDRVEAGEGSRDQARCAELYHWLCAHEEDHPGDYRNAAIRDMVHAMSRLLRSRPRGFVIAAAVALAATGCGNAEQNDYVDQVNAIQTNLQTQATAEISERALDAGSGGRLRREAPDALFRCRRSARGRRPA